MTTPSKYLAIYLNDHLAGATAGVELSKRSPAPAGLAQEIERDRDVLLDVMRRLGVQAGRAKPAAAWIGERLGRLKLNGEVRGTSPLSPLVELEALALGVEGKLALWRALEQTVGEDPRLTGVDLPGLIDSASDQHGRLEALRLEAAGAALSA